MSSSFRSIFAVITCLFASGCFYVPGSCDEYASKYSCNYVENYAEYEVWYWRNLESDNEEDEILIGRAQGLHMCQGNAEAFAAAIGESFNSRAYICVLMGDDQRMEKHRLLNIYDPQ